MKGVILAAGYGTRFLPATKTVPKELFPLVDTPAISLIVEEFLQAGLQEIIVISSRRKKALEDYFDREVELESVFHAEQAHEKARRIRPPDAHVVFLRQAHMLGTGDALLLLEPVVGQEPFVVAYPDDLLWEGPSLSGQLIETYRRTGCTVLAAQELRTGDVSRYGVLATHGTGAAERVCDMVEKPPPGTEPSRLVSYGRYLYTAEIFPALRKTRQDHTQGEFTQTAALRALAAKDRLSCCRFQGRILDVGAPQGYLQATIEYALSRVDLREDLLRYLRQRVPQD